jgi:poly(3-hydroxyalkanoate) synthetase
VLRESGADAVNLVGYCMGGNLALLALAAIPTSRSATS